MAFIQFTLLHIPAIVIHGDALTNEVRSTWPTLAHTMGDWNRKLHQSDDTKPTNVEVESLNMKREGSVCATAALQIQTARAKEANLREGQLALF